MIRRLLAATLAGVAIVALGGGLLYGVVGGRPTPPGARILPPPIQPQPGQPRPDGHHILILGTSLTSRGDWPELLQQRLQACADAAVTVERLSRAGAASDWGLAALRARLAAPPQTTAQTTAPATPDIVVVEFSGNDASLIHGFPLVKSRRNHLEMLDLIRKNGATPILATMSPGWGWKALARPGQDRYHALYRDLAASAQAGLIDTIADWRALPPGARHAAVPDDLHPTAAAMAAIAVPAFEAALRSLVCAR